MDGWTGTAEHGERVAVRTGAPPCRTCNESPLLLRNQWSRPHTRLPVLARLLGVGASLLEQELAATSAEQAAQPGSVAPAFVQHALALPGVVTMLPDSLVARLRQPLVLQPLLTAAADAAAGGQLRGSHAAATLGNLSHLVLAQPGHPLPSSAAELLALPAPQQLADASTAAAFAAAAARLLAMAAAGLDGHSAAVPAATLVRSQVALLAAQRPQLALLRALGDAVPLFAALALHLLLHLPTVDQQLAGAAGSGGGRGAPSATATDNRGGEASTSGGASGMDGGSAASGLPGGGGGAGSVSALNTLAFTPQILPALWRWLALNVGLPLEAPAGARLGLDVAAVAGGAQSLAPAHALVLGVFCRCTWRRVGCGHKGGAMHLWVAAAAFRKQLLQLLRAGVR